MKRFFTSLKRRSEKWTFPLVVGCLFVFVQIASAQESVPNEMKMTYAKHHVNCHQGNDGYIEVFAQGGSGNYEYSINSSPFSKNNRFDHLIAATHIIQVKDLNVQTQDSVTTELVVINEPEKLTMKANIDNVSWLNGNDGRAWITAEGGKRPYQFSLDGQNFGVDSIFNNLTTGHYTAYVKDKKGCLGYINFRVSNPSLDCNLQVTIQEPLPLVCPEASTASIRAFVSGGSGHYEYDWALDETDDWDDTDQLFNLKAGSYTLRVRDHHNPSCVVEKYYIVKDPAGMELDLSYVCKNLSTAAVSLNIKGGTKPYTVNWSNGSTALYLPSESTEQTLKVTVTDASGCTTIDSIYVPNCNTCLPACKDLNVSIQSDGYVQILPEEMVGRECSFPMQVIAKTPYGLTIFDKKIMHSRDIIRFEACQYLDKTLTLEVYNDKGGCQSDITFKKASGPKLVSQLDTTVWCIDSFLQKDPTDADYPYPAKIVYGCGYTGAAIKPLPDWPEYFPCDNDTLKVIYREWETFDKDGRRSTATDTIVVLRLPQLEAENIWCPLKDTVYCQVDKDGNGYYPEDNVEGARIILPVLDKNGPTGACDTFLIENYTKEAKNCGLKFHTERQVFPATCNTNVKLTLQIKQDCYGNLFGYKPVPDHAGAKEVKPGFFECTKWIQYQDTLGPALKLKEKLWTISTTSHDCEALLQIPSIEVVDDCEGVKWVKATVEDKGAFVLTPNADKPSIWENKVKAIRLPIRDVPYTIVYEALDQCHNVSRDTIKVKVKDLVKPNPICNRELSVVLSTKKTWVDALDFDEKSQDNCGISFILARRSDWDEFCMDLCTDKTKDVNSIEKLLKLSFRDLLSDGEEVEAHYKKYLDWVTQENGPCYKMLYYSWMYDLYTTVAKQCDLTDEHGNKMYSNVYRERIRKALEEKYKVEKIDTTLGGGWSPQVPFGCDDVCDTVKVEVLVMDYWCNYAKCWVATSVEEKDNPVLQQKLGDVSISCEAYDKYYKAIVDQAVEGKSSQLAPLAFENLDEIFGTYQKGWWTESAAVYANGNPLPKTKKYKDVYCEEKITVDKVADTLHDGTIVWNEVENVSIIYKDQNKLVDQGIVTVQCNVSCDQDIWVELDECHVGKITRRFTVTSGCGDKAEETVYLQTIEIRPACKLKKAMFSFPADTEICSPLRYGEDANVILPAEAGVAEIVHPLGCRRVGISHKDKVIKLVDEKYGYKILRTWTVSDWCQDETITCLQTIALTDTCNVDQVLLTGEITDMKSRPVPQVVVNWQKEEGAAEQIISQSKGRFEMLIDKDKQGRLTAEMTGEDLRGISTRDLVLVHRDILGRKRLGRLEQLAADVNQDGKIDARDLIEIKRMILGKTKSFSSGAYWKFYDKSKMTSFIDVKATEDLWQEFIGVKLGDVNVDYIGQTNRSNASTLLQYELASIEAGEQKSIDIYANDSDLEALQLALNTDQYTIDNVAFHQAVEGSEAHEGRIIWLANEEINTAEPIMTLTITANAYLSGDILALNTSAMSPEGYTYGGETKQIWLAPKQEIVDILYFQVHPNPIYDRAQVQLEVGAGQSGRLEIFDSQGKTVWSNTYELMRGVNTIDLDRTQFPHSGMYLLRVATKNEIKTTKVVIQ